MLTVIEHQQQLTRAQDLTERLPWIGPWPLANTEGRRHRGGDLCRIAHRRELHEPRAIRVICLNGGGGCQRQARLSNAANPDQREQSSCPQDRCQINDQLLPTDKTAQLTRRIASESSLYPSSKPHGPERHDGPAPGQAAWPGQHTPSPGCRRARPPVWDCLDNPVYPVLVQGVELPTASTSMATRNWP